STGSIFDLSFQKKLDDIKNRKWVSCPHFIPSPFKLPLSAANGIRFDSNFYLEYIHDEPPLTKKD
ncbi:MAG: hypothetical protein KAW19_04245, partial [Candidatus Aminicenantes bacterium]|nr:hypothetical protein [Candidatus Aminicenantes bacterium]